MKAAIFRRAKKIGADKDVLRELFRISQMGEDERREHFDTLASYAGMAGVALFSPGVDPRAEQADLWMDDATSAEAKHARDLSLVYTEGRNAAQLGLKAEDNQHPVGSEFHQAWRQGFDDYKAGRPALAFLGKTQEAEIRKASEKQKPGRPKAEAGNGVEPPKRDRARKAAPSSPASA